MQRLDKTNHGQPSSSPSGTVSSASAAIKTFRAPVVLEADDDVILDPARCQNGARVLTGKDIQDESGGTVRLFWRGKTAGGDQPAPYTQSHPITSSFEANQPITFDPVPLDQIMPFVGGNVSQCRHEIKYNSLISKPRH